jgi:hypothetical protein
MQVAARSYLAAGVALVGAGAIAVSPVSPPVPKVMAASPAVALSASIDPITPWLNVFNTSEVNFANLVGKWLEAPAPVLQQVIANQIGYLSQLPDFPAIVEEIAANAEAAIRAPFAVDLTTMDSLHATIYDLLLNGLPPIIDPVVPADLAPLVQFSTTYLSGVLLGLVGPAINPALALGGSLNTVFENLTGEAPDLEAALNTLLNTPAAMADAFLNGGQSIDITPLLNAVGLESPIPGLNFSAELVFGGLLSPGGSIFNALTIDLGDGSGPTGVGPGAIGSLIGLTQQIAKALGWDGTGNPLAPPLNTPQETLREADSSAITATPSDNATLVSVDLPKESATAEETTTGDTPPAKDDTVTAVPATDDSGDDEVAGEVTAGDEDATGTDAGETAQDTEATPSPKEKTKSYTSIRTRTDRSVRSGDNDTTDSDAKDNPDKESTKAASGSASSDKGESGSGGDSSTGGAE